MDTNTELANINLVSYANTVIQVSVISDNEVSRCTEIGKFGNY